MQIPSPGFIFSAFFQAFRRFPGAMICALAGTAVAWALVDSVHAYGRDLGRALMPFALGLPLMTAVTAFAASRYWNERLSWALQAGAFLLMAVCWWYFDPHAADFERVRIFQYFALLLIAHLAVAVAPYLNERPVRDFWEYNRQIFAQFIMGAAFSLILFAGLSLALLAIDNLFNINLPDRIYGRLFVILAGTFNSTYFLYQFPQSYALSDPEGNTYNWVFRTLCKYILIPIVLLYFLILYTYGAKIGLQWSLPKGWVGSLVIGFSVAGIFTYLLNFYLDEVDNSLIVGGFKRYFWWVLLPLTGLLFVAIGKRISDYGVTEDRYMVLLLGSWLALACCYFLISKHDNIKYIPISLAIGSAIWAFGPLSAFSVSERSQKHILREMLEQNGYWENGKVKKGNKLITEPEYQQISSTISYLENHEALAEFYPQPADSNAMKPGGLLDWLQIESEEEKNRVKPVSLSGDDIDELDTRGFDKAYHVRLNTEGVPEELTKQEKYFTLSKNGQMLECWENKGGSAKILEFYDLRPTLAAWRANPEVLKGENYLSISESERLIHLKGKKMQIAFQTERAEFNLRDLDKGFIYLDGWLLLKTE